MITTKKSFLELWNGGVLGNKLRTWNSYEELLDSGYKGPVGIRSRVANANVVRYYVPHKDIPSTIVQMAVTPSLLYFGEPAPDDLLILQGEFFHGEAYKGSFLNRYLQYSRLKGPMRKAMALPLYPYPESTLVVSERECWRYETSGLSTTLLLKSLMNGNSYDDFVALQERYPDHVIEFGVYSTCLGSCDARNTIIWEIRLY